MSACLGSWCPQCGSNVSVDEDGCCISCGCCAVGQGADEAFATIADLRDRLRIMARVVCEGCGCEARCGDRALCWDCNTARLSCVLDGWSQDSSHAAACVSVGLRALCGRRTLEGC